MTITVTFEDHIALEVRDQLFNRAEQLGSYEPTPENRREVARLWLAVQSIEKVLPKPAPRAPRKERYGVYERRVVRIVCEFSRDRTPMVEFILDGETYQTSVGLVGELE